MSKWVDSKYEGEQLDGWFHGKGKYYFPTGVIYEGDFYQGEFHGEGILIYPNGGRYQAKWDRGKMLEGTYFFEDALQYEQVWNYCTGNDRRFHQEIKSGIKPAGVTQETAYDQPFDIPEATYDVGEGYYEPVKSIIYKYDGTILRTPSEAEVENIVKKCRYNPKKDIVMSGESDKLVFEFIAKPTNSKTKNDLMAVSSSLKKLPFEAQQFRQYCLNSKVFSLGDQPKFVYLVTKGEFAIIKYCKVTTNNPFQILQKLFQQEKLIPKQVKVMKAMDVFALDEIYEDKYSYEVICNSSIGEVFCIRHQVFEKVKLPVKKKPLQIEVYDQPIKPPIMEIQSAKGSTPMNRLYLNQIPRRPEEISTHRHEKKTIDFTSYRVTLLKKIQKTEIIQEIEEPPLNNRFMEDF